MAYLSNVAGVEPGDFGVRSSFDVVPTLVELAGARVPAGLSGNSLLDELLRSSRRRVDLGATGG
jgi:hypothetical protein